MATLFDTHFIALAEAAVQAAETNRPCPFVPTRDLALILLAQAAASLDIGSDTAMFISALSAAIAFPEEFTLEETIRRIIEALQKRCDPLSKEDLVL